MPWDDPPVLALPRDTAVAREASWARTSLVIECDCESGTKLEERGGSP